MALILLTGAYNHLEGSILDNLPDFDLEELVISYLQIKKNFYVLSNSIANKSTTFYSSSLDNFYVPSKVSRDISDTLKLSLSGIKVEDLSDIVTDEDYNKLLTVEEIFNERLPVDLKAFILSVFQVPIPFIKEHQ